ncbi:hypothetical protein AB1Y20_000189 [Prymnesium parvum]|uniref:Centrosomal protein of 162 kDa n=1 Tax=Prymnesium parvum TaxID=97485 RepID=A0AB34K5N3_PRYPA
MAEEEFYSEEEGEEEDEPIVLHPGEGLANVRSAQGLEQKLAELSSWEAQLHEYSAQLAEQGWKEWKKAAVTSVMSELTRKVVPDLWKGEVEQHRRRSEEMAERLRVAAEKERGLLARIHELQHGPGCAREVREKLEQAEVQLQQHAARERQRKVLAQMSIGQVAGGQPRDEPAAAAGGGGVPKSELETELQLRAAKAEREVRELLEEMTATRIQTNEREEALRRALDDEKKDHRRTREELESLFLGAGVHEAQMMTQLRLEIRALKEENEFFRSREEHVQKEENRLQMVSEMAKKLGTNISKFELASLRSQVESSEAEAARLHETNMELQKQLQRMNDGSVQVEQMKAELAVFQAANDTLEASVQKERSRNARLQTELEETREKLDVLMRQLLLRHVSTGRQPPAAADGKSARRRLVPLVWDSDSSHGEPPPPTRAAPRATGSPPRPQGVGTVAPDGTPLPLQRAVTLRDDAVAKPLKVTVVQPAVARAARAVPAASARRLAIESNEALVVANSVRSEVEREQGEVTRVELQRLHDADLQELQVMRGRCESLLVTMRATKLESLHHWWQSAAMRAFRQWALLLELRASYDAAFGVAAHLLARGAEVIAGSLGDATQQTIETLLMEPALLQPLGELRFKLQAASAEAEALRGRLQQLKEEGYEKASPAPWLPASDEVDALRGLALPRLRAPSAARDGRQLRVITQTEAHAGARALAAAREREEAARREAERERAHLTLKLRLVVHHWRALRRQLAEQRRLLGQLSAQRNDELAAAAEENQQLKQLRATLVEMGESEREMRQMLAEQERQLSASAATSAQARAEHEEEVAYLSAKIRQQEEERVELQAVIVQQAADIDVLMQAVSSRPRHEA